MAKERIIVALDTPNPTEAVRTLRPLEGQARWVKIGHALINSLGLVEAIRLVEGVLPNSDVMIDQKLKDIPNQVAVFSRQTVEAGAAMFTLHCDGGEAMMAAARKGVLAAASPNPCKIIGVTLLTSLSHHDLVRFGWFPEFEVSERVQRTRINDYVCRYAVLAKECGLDGVVASPWEAAMIRGACGADFLIVTPSIRPAEFDPDDQSRHETPANAVRAGANMLVVGRPITAAPRHMGALAAFRLIDMEIEEALFEKEGLLREPKGSSAVTPVAS